MNTAESIRYLPKPVPLRAVPQRRDIPTDYASLAAEIGFAPRELLHGSIRDFLNASGIPIYANSEVNGYMDRLAKAADQYWDWYALRPVDVCGNVRGRDCPWKGRGTVGDRMTEVYARVVPIEHLRNVKIIAERFPEARFFVTDYKDEKPDPFICVWPEVLPEPIVFGVWDEPGFGG